MFSNPEEIEREMRRMHLKKEEEEGDEEDSDEGQEVVGKKEKKKKAAVDSSSEEEESDEEEDSDDEEDEKHKAKGVSRLIEIENPNRVAKKPGEMLVATKLYTQMC